MESLPGYDRWLARYQRDTIQVWCSNPACRNHDNPETVLHEQEYGTGWTTPEECGECGSDWLYEAPDNDNGSADLSAGAEAAAEERAERVREDRMFDRDDREDWR